MIDWLIPPDWASACRWCPRPITPGSLRDKEFKQNWDEAFVSFDEALKLVPQIVEPLALAEPAIAPSSYVALTCLLKDTDYAAVDVDLDKQLVSDARFKHKNYDPANWRDYLGNVFKEQKIKLVEYALERHHVRRSTNGGFHIVVRDPERKLPHTSASPRYLAEIKTNGILYVKSYVESNLPIATYDDELVSWYFLSKTKGDIGAPAYKARHGAPQSNLTTKTNIVSDNDLFDDTITDNNINRVKETLTKIVEITKTYFPRIPEACLLRASGDDDGFWQLCKYLTGILTTDEFVRFCRQQPYKLTTDSGETLTKEEYFRRVATRFNSTKRHYTYDSQLSQFFSFAKGRMKIFEEAKASRMKSEGFRQPVRFNETYYTNLTAIKSTSPLDVPKGRVTVVYGPSNVGKTSIVLATVIGFAKAGKRVFYISNDMLEGELRPYYFAYGLEGNTYDWFTWDDDVVVSADLLQGAIDYCQPDLIVIDTLDSMLLSIDRKFQLETFVGCHDGMTWLKKLLITNQNKFGILGLCHIPKDRFYMPHSAKFKAYLYRSYLVMDLGHAIANKWYRKDIVKQWKNEQPDGTILIYPDKIRGADKTKDPDGWWIYFNQPPDKLHPGDWQPRKPSDWESVVDLPPLADCDIFGDNKELSVDLLMTKLKKKFNRDEEFTRSAVVRILRPHNKASVEAMIDQAIAADQLFIGTRTDKETWRLRLTPRTTINPELPDAD